ncbi:myofilin isoform X5 [Cotesia typhae]|uniref:myofilin isoform X5 n=1 Tax=Cotesia typhae TaxID=2053667 RepID=UPI003D68A8EE
MDARFKSNLAMIGRNEPITRKARFWQSYVRALKGTDDMRAPEHTRKPRSIFSDYPELHSSSWPYGKSIFDNPSHASDRINVPGYRYLPVHREIYGYSPRQLYPHQYKPVERFVSACAR